MIKISNVWTGGFEGAIRGMRNPYESHEKSDSRHVMTVEQNELGLFKGFKFQIGEADMKLCKKLIKAGSEHRKFMRVIHVQAEVRAPRYWWAEMDKYKWVEANSSSTMHLITKRPLTINDFSYDNPNDGFKFTVRHFNNLMKEYNEKNDKTEKEELFRKIKQLLPESFMQLRMIDTNYECLLSIYHQRKNHRLHEWREFCDWIKSLPYMEEFIDAVSL